jgi:hypothetical protein
MLTDEQRDAIKKENAAHRVWEAAQIKKYPDLYRENTLPMSETCMCWGLCVGPGWYKLIEDLQEELDLIQKASGIQIIATQVKEKFGGLRYYYTEDWAGIGYKYPDSYYGFDWTHDEAHAWSRIIGNTVYRAEIKSEHTCEVCGKYGKISGRPWVKCLCDKCRD